MSKNLEDLLYRGDSLDKMGQMSSDLRESSKKYKRAAVRINWELLLKQVRLDSISWSRGLKLIPQTVRTICWSWTCHPHLLHLALLVEACFAKIPFNSSQSLLVSQSLLHFTNQRAGLASPGAWNIMEYWHYNGQDSI